jgi:DNA polymerase-1
LLNNSVALPTEFDRYDEITVVDFEFKFDPNDLPVPQLMCAIEMRSGREIMLWREDLVRLRRAPFGTGSRHLVAAYSSNAEMLCFLRLGWPLPENVFDPYVNTAALTNGSKRWPYRNFRPGLLTAMQFFGLQGIEAADKDAMVRLILKRETYSNEDRALIAPYCRSDVVGLCALILAQAGQLDMPTALHWGRFQKAVARQEQLGLPVDVAALDRYVTNWAALQLDAIARYGVGAFYDGTRFKEDRLETLIEERGWSHEWPRTPTGKYETKTQTIARQAERHPELKALAELRGRMTDLRMTNLRNSIGADGYARCPLRPFSTVTSRNAPSAADKSFLPALPAWLHGVQKPPPGFALIEADWSSQEVGLMAAFSGDPNMIADYLAGDCHTAFALRAALITAETDEEERALIRSKQAKPVVLGSNYGMSPYGIQAKTRRSLDWARHIHRQHREVYRTFHQWLDDVVTQARFDRRLLSANGWPLEVHEETRDTTLMNYLAQAGGADAMRHAAIALIESGLAVCCSVHDSFKVLAPLDRLERTTSDVTEIMQAAGAAITGSFGIPAKIKTPVRAPARQADAWTAADKGLRTWIELQARLDSGQLPVVSNEDDNDEDEATATAS